MFLRVERLQRTHSGSVCASLTVWLLGSISQHCNSKLIKWSLMKVPIQILSDVRVCCCSLLYVILNETYLCGVVVLKKNIQFKNAAYGSFKLSLLFLFLTFWFEVISSGKLYILSFIRMSCQDLKYWHSNMWSVLSNREGLTSVPFLWLLIR